MEGVLKNDGKEDVGTNGDSWGQKGTNGVLPIHILRGDPFLFGKSDFEIAVACGRYAQYATKLLRPNLPKILFGRRVGRRAAPRHQNIDLRM